MPRQRDGGNGRSGAKGDVDAFDAANPCFFGNGSLVFGQEGCDLCCHVVIEYLFQSDCVFCFGARRRCMSIALWPTTRANWGVVARPRSSMQCTTAEWDRRMVAVPRNALSLLNMEESAGSSTGTAALSSLVEGTFACEVEEWGFHFEC